MTKLNSITTQIFSEKIKNSLLDNSQKFDQSYLYLHDDSVTRWVDYASHPDYIAAQNIPFDEVAKTIEVSLDKTQIRPHSLSILSIACGHAPLERKLLDALLNHTKIVTIELSLFDISDKLVELAAELTKNHLSLHMGHSAVQVRAIQGDFYKLHEHNSSGQLLPPTTGPLLVAMLGYTFSNLENEVAFLHQQLNSFESGTLFLVDIGLVFAPFHDPKAIHQHDPWLSGHSHWKEEAEKFWAIPFLAHHPDVKNFDDLKIIPTLDNTSRVIDESYVIEMQVEVANHSKRHTIQRYKRYTKEPFIQTFANAGWQLVQQFPFYNGQRVALLFCKQ